MCYIYILYLHSNFQTIYFVKVENDVPFAFYSLIIILCSLFHVFIIMIVRILYD